MSLWENANTTAKIGIFVVLVILAIIYLPRLGGLFYSPQTGPPGDFKPADEAPSTPPRKAVVPAETKPGDFAGKLTVEIKVPKSDTAQTVTVEVLNPKDMDTPPYYSVQPKDSSVVVKATYSEFSDPIVDFEPRIAFGGCVDKDLAPSPFLGVRLARLAFLYAGAGVDRFGLGPNVAVTIWPERSIRLFAQYELVRFRESQYSIGILMEL